MASRPRGSQCRSRRYPIVKKIPTFATLAVLALVLGARPASPQDAVMYSAETITPGNFTIAAYPVRDLDADETGVVGRAGIALTEGVDVEGRVGFYDGLLYFGGDIELWLVRDRSSFDFSVGGGLHRSDFDGGVDVFGIDAFAILSGHLTPNVELYGALDLDFERPSERFDDYTLAHAVAGLEIRVSDALDVHLEGGAGLNDRSNDYLAAGLAVYIQ
jgi:hypothetical protein